MTIYRISPNKFNIFLTKTEIQYGFGGYENLIFMQNGTKEKIKSLVLNILKPTFNNMTLKGKIVILKSGCIINIDIINKGKETVYLFENCDRLIGNISYLYPFFKFEKSDLYLYKNEYYLSTNREFLPLKKYKTKNKILIAKAKEYGKPLVLNDAIYRFGKAFIKDF